MSTEKIEKRLKRRRRIRGRVTGNGMRPRLSVFRSNDHIYAQVIDDVKGMTLAAASDKEILKKGEKKSGTKMEKAFKVGELIAQKLNKKKIKKIVFDRGGFKYHGRTKALAEGAKKGGLEF